MSIYNNAIDSIVIGVEDYNSSKDDQRRLLSSTRNLVAGILLLIKAKLASVSPAGSDDVFIKERVLPEIGASGIIVWKGFGSRTVNVAQMEERCDGLGIIVDWKSIKHIVKTRNDIEHYFHSLNANALRTLLRSSFILIRDILRTQLNKDPRTELGTLTWQTLTGILEVYDKELTECIERIKSIEWKYAKIFDALMEWECAKCGSGLIDVTNPGVKREEARFFCRACGEKYDFQTAIEKSIISFYSWSNHYAAKDGEDPVTIECPFCNCETYDLEHAICLICEKSKEVICRRCGKAIPPEEIDGSGICDYCEHLIE